MSWPLGFWKTVRPSRAARRAGGRPRKRFRPQAEQLEPRLTPAQVPLTVTVTGVGVNSGDATFFAAVTINGVRQESPREFGSSLFVNWPITQQVEDTAPAVVSIDLFDDGGGQIDIDPKPGDQSINLTIDPRTGYWFGDLQWPSSLSQGGGDGRAGSLSFAVSSSGTDSTKDSDGDGLPDLWEVNGFDSDANRGNGVDVPLNAPGWGADPRHKDLFLEFDWMAGAVPNREEIQSLKAAFAVAPVDAGTKAADQPGGVNAKPNPDNQPGINLHVDTGSLTDASGQLVGDNLGGGNLVSTINISNLNSNFALIKNGDGTPANPANFNAARRLVFRYAISGSSPTNTGGTSTGGNGTTTLNDTSQNWVTNEWQYGTPLVVTITGGTGAGQSANIVSNTATQLTVDTAWATTPDNTSTYTIGWSSGGWGEQGGNDFIEYNHDAGSIMHELGHTLNLDHGGFEARNYKPNYVSVMNYDHQFGIPQNSGATIIDYSPAKVSVGGTTTGGNTATTFNDTTQSWTVNQWAGGYVELNRSIGFTTGGNTSNTLNDTAQNWGVNQLVGASVSVSNGAGGLQTLRIVSNTATRLVVSGSWTATPGLGSGYFLNLRQVRRIVSNTATQLVLDPSRPWASVPAFGTPYAVYTPSQTRGAATLPQLTETGLPETLVLDSTDTANRMIFSDSAGNKTQFPLNGLDRNVPPDGVIDGPDYDNDNVVDTATVSVNADAPNDTIINAAPMVGHDDWRRISLPFRQFGNSASSAINPETDPLPTLAELLAFQAYLNTADLRLSVTTSASTVFQGDHLVYTYTATVNGPNPADAVTILDTLPAGVDFVSASSSQGTASWDGTTVKWNPGAVWPDVSVTLRLEVIPYLVGPMTNTATASTIDTDPATGNNASATTVQVLNIPPEITFINVSPTSINENDEVVLTVRFTDPGRLDRHTAEINWGDGSVETVPIPFPDREFAVRHRYLDDNPTNTPVDSYAIRVTVRDNNGGSDTDGTAVTVNNVAPVFTALATSSASSGPAAEGEPVTISGAFTDVGTLDTHAVNVDWGDGTVSAAQVAQGAGSGSFAAQHAYQFGGIYPVLVTLRDDDTGAVSRTKTVFVTGVGVHEVGGLTSLQVVGTIGPDQVTINEQGNGLITVHADFLRAGQRTLPSAGLDIIQVVTLAGDDHVTVGGSVDLPAVIDGGDGDDHLNGDGVGGVVIGGRGNDELLGGNGRDILIGGVGADRLVGNGADDILVGGRTAYDSGADDDKLANDLALLKVLEEWNSTRTFPGRVANLRAGVGPVLAGTGLSLVKGVTVFDDLEADDLNGSSGMDWLFLDAADSSANGELTN
jgi:uncharacterized repeat protein (TIGR01451 family)